MDVDVTWTCSSRGSIVRIVCLECHGSMEHCLLHRFLVAQVAPALKTMHLAVTMKMGSGSKASLADSILSKIDEAPDLERKTRMYAEVLDRCTRIAVRRFVLANLDGRKGITLGTTKTDAIAAFVSLAMLDRSPTRIRNSNRRSSGCELGIPNPSFKSPTAHQFKKNTQIIDGEPGIPNPSFKSPTRIRNPNRRSEL